MNVLMTRNRLACIAQTPDIVLRAMAEEAPTKFAKLALEFPTLHAIVPPSVCSPQPQRQIRMRTANIENVSVPSSERLTAA